MLGHIRRRSVAVARGLRGFGTAAAAPTTLPTRSLGTSGLEVTEISLVGAGWVPQPTVALHTALISGCAR